MCLRLATHWMLMRFSFNYLIDHGLQRFIALVVAVLALAITIAICGESPGIEKQATFAARDLLRSNETILSHSIRRDTNGALVSLLLASKYNDAQSLDLISKCDSLRELTIRGTPITNKFGLTEIGIASLGRLSNLTTLRLSCFPKTGLDRGVLRGISKMQQLRYLELYYTIAPTDEYAQLTNMLNLSHLRLVACSNFGDRELRFLTNLIHLEDLELIGTGVSVLGTNELRGLHSITNVHLESRE